MLILKKLHTKLILISKQEFGLRDLGLEIISHIVNFSKPQRYLRRKKFPIEKVICNSINGDDYAQYHKFLTQYSFSFRKNPNQNLHSPPILNSNPKNLYYVARLKNEIIACVNMCYINKQQGINFWFISGLCVLRNFQGRGVGERLVKSICSDVSAISVENSVIYLGVDQLNFRAQNLYKKLGFREDALLKNIILGNKDYNSISSNSLLLFKNLN